MRLRTCSLFSGFLCASLSRAKTIKERLHSVEEKCNVKIVLYSITTMGKARQFQNLFFFTEWGRSYSYLALAPNPFVKNKDCQMVFFFRKVTVVF